MRTNIFPTIPDGKWSKIDLNEESKSVNVNFNDPSAFQDWLDSVHKRKRVKYSYGGFLEDKSNVWKNNYQKLSRAFIHLGIDYNLPEDNFVCLFDKGTVENVFLDKDLNGGWGGRIIWKMDSGIYAIYGHLKVNIKLKPGQKCEKGDVVGVIGNSRENGGWYPHLHVQIMKSEFIKKYSDLREIDGYLQRDSKLLKYLIDPNKFIRVPLC